MHGRFREADKHCRVFARPDSRGRLPRAGREQDMTGLRFPKITLWRVMVAVIFVAGLYATYARFALGFSQATHLTDPQPWGLWVGLGTLCGVGLSAGGFGIAAAVYLLGFERYRPVLRTAVLVSFLGYVSVIVGMMYELGLPWRIWHPIFMWNRHSMLFEVSWCVMLYTTVLSFEFSPALVEKIPWKRAREWYLKQQHRILIGLVLVGCVLSSLHQSFLGGLYLLTKGKLDPLWYTPYLTTLFYLSAIPAGLAVTVMALYLCVRSLNVKLDTAILSELSRVIAPMLALYAIFRGVDLYTHGALPYMFKWREETFVLARDRTAGCGAAGAAEHGEGEERSEETVLDLQPGGDGLHGEPLERFDHGAAGERRGVLRAEVDRVRGYADGVDGGGDGVPLRSDLSRYPSEESTAALDDDGDAELGAGTGLGFRLQVFGVRSWVSGLRCQVLGVRS